MLLTVSVCSGGMFKYLVSNLDGRLRIACLVHSLDSTQSDCCRIYRNPVFLSVIY
jgi:hypothetical protein